MCAYYCDGREDLTGLISEQLFCFQMRKMNK